MVTFCTAVSIPIHYFLLNTCRSVLFQFNFPYKLYRFVPSGNLIHVLPVFEREVCLGLTEPCFECIKLGRVWLQSARLLRGSS